MVTEMRIYKEIKQSHQNFSGENFHSLYTGGAAVDWNKKIPKAYYVGIAIMYEYVCMYVCILYFNLIYARNEEVSYIHIDGFIYSKKFNYI